MIRIARAVEAADMESCLNIRHEVFIVEQSVSEADEIDGLDADCLQYLAWDGEIPVATARVMTMNGDAKIQRVAVRKSHRGTGLGADLMRFILKDLKPDFKSAKLGSQTHAIGFYEKLGFQAFGPEYLDAGIPHRDMRLELS